MRTIYKLLSIFWLLFLSNNTHAADITLTEAQSLVREGIQRISNTNKQQWAFELHSFESEEGDITQYSASFNGAAAKGEQWQLITLNGEAATKKQHREFIKERQKEQQKLKEKFNIKLNQLVDIDSVQIIDDSEEQLQVTFKVNIDELGDDANEKLLGQLTLNKTNKLIHQIEINNISEFSPMAMTTIDSFKMVLQFNEFSEQVLLKTTELMMAGTFAGFIELNEISKDEYKFFKKLE